MKGLVLKDLLATGKTLKQYLFILAFFVIYCYVLKNNSMLMMCIICFPSCVLTAFYYDDAANWNKYALTMNISVKTLVGCKYMLLFLLSLCSFIITVIFDIILSILMKKNLTSIGENMILFVGMSLYIILIHSVVIYFTFKNGSEKTRIIMLVVYVIPIALVFSIYKAASIILSAEQILAVIRFAKHNYFLLAILIIIFVISCIYLSFLKSVKVIKNKDF